MKSIKPLFIGLTTTIVGVVLGWYLSNIYQKPQIEWYSRPYYKIDDIAIGNIFLVNTGQTPDKNITITLVGNIKEDEIKIVDTPSPYKIIHNDNKTSIIIEELKPQEEADITFKDVSSKDSIEIYNFVSQYSNIVEKEWAATTKWWYLPLWVYVLVLIIVFCLGIVFNKFYKFDFFDKKEVKLSH